MIQFKNSSLPMILISAISFITPSFAEDIDLFVGVENAESSKSDVLFVFDTGANFSSSASSLKCYINSTTKKSQSTSASGFTETSLSGTAGGVQQCAMYSVIAGLDSKQTASLRIGIMGLNVTGQAIKTYNPASNTWSNCKTGNGGCLLIPMTDISDSTTRNRLLDWIQNIKTSGNTDYNIKGNNAGDTGAVMQESWAYLFGKQGLSTTAYPGLPSAAGTCSPNKYLIYLANSFSNSAGANDQTNGPELTLKGTSSVSAQNAQPSALASHYAEAKGTVKTKCGNFVFDSSANNYKSGIYAAHWAAYLRNQGVKSYGLGVVDPGSCKPDYPAILGLLAAKGGGKYYDASNSEELKAALSTILDEIMAVNGVFASASLPVSVNTQGTYLNQVFVGMFRPQADKTPRWMGNMKQYKFKASQSGGSYTLQLVGADDVGAINTNTGFITQCARSFWGPASKPTTDYWSYPGSTLGTCSTVEASSQSDFPDGDVVEKGAAGYQLRVGGMVPANRVVKTCAGTCTSLTDFDASSDLNKWVRGQDTLDDENRNSNTTEVRPSVHGDVVHSRPVAVDYGGTTGVVVFYGANDGMLRAINGNQTGTDAGKELWAFVAPEQASRFNRIYTNTTKIDFPSQKIAANQKPYFFDGPVTAYKNGSTVWIYATQRRGGRMIYAFNVSTAASPSIKWRAGCTDSTDASCTSTDLTGMGQTWSAPRAMRTQAAGTSTAPLLIFGGGYDACEDTITSSTTNNSCTAPKGNQVYVLNADTGALVKKFDTLRSVVGDVTIVRNASGVAQYGYAADTGGNVYRINLTGASTSDWSITHIAALGRDTTPYTSTDGASTRKFMYGPEVVVVSTRGYNAVLLGSGDREHPLPTHTATAAVQNYFYMLMDKPTDASWLSAESTACGSDLLCHASLLNIVATSSATVAKDLEGKKGWKMQLRAKEQVVTSAVALFGTVTFSTHQPLVEGAESCSNSLGTARVYNVSYLNAAPPTGTTKRGEEISGGGLPPAPVAGMVTVPKPGGGEMTVPFIIGAKSDSPLEVEMRDPGSSSSTNKERIYWYIQK